MHKIGPAEVTTDGFVLVSNDQKFVHTYMVSTHVGYRHEVQLVDKIENATVFVGYGPGLREAFSKFTVTRMEVKVTRKIEFVTEELEFNLKPQPQHN